MSNYLFLPPASEETIPKICLNMIVKNESHIIERLLHSVLPLIDCYCICDTGSTDNTMVLIRRFFQSKHISGKIIEEPFRDFAYNRNHALKHASAMVSETDYILLVDADMVLQIDPAMVSTFKKSLFYDAYYALQGTDTFCYKNIRLLKNNETFSYWGVTHEYIQLSATCTTSVLERDVFFLKDIGDGGSKKDKFERDIRLLEKGLKENPKNHRYTFYLANSFRDAGKSKDAIDMYKKRIELGGWIEEVWFSYYSIGKCYQALKEPANAIFYWLEAYHCNKHRLENLYQIIHYYREQCKYPIAYTFYAMARNSPVYGKKNIDALFLEKDVYEYKLDYEFSIVGYYCNWYDYNMLKANQTVMSCDITPEEISKNLLSNYKFYAPVLEEYGSTDSDMDILKIAEEGGGGIPAGADFVSSTPSIVLDTQNKRIILCIRYVNYQLSTTCSGYKLKDTITTKNRILVFSSADGTFQKVKDCWLQYDTSHDAYYCGIEDVRLFLEKTGEIAFNGNRVLRTGEIVIEHGKIDWKKGCTVSDLVRTKTDRRKVEKNWVLFGENRVVYEWFPLTIGEYRRQPNGEMWLEIVGRKKTPSVLKRVRGSSNGLEIGTEGEIWFLCHIVSYEDKSYYYHLFVVLDKTTEEVKRVSHYFTFGKGKNVEYCLGFLYLEQEGVFLFGYSQMDCDTRFLSVEKSKLDGLF